MPAGREGEPIAPTVRNPDLEAGEPEGSTPGAVRKRPPWAPGDPNAEGGSFGAWLRRQREMREIDLHEIAERTKISLRYLQAMEQDRFELLPAPVFARGFLREYAKYVGLSPDEVVNYYLSALGGDQEEGGEHEPAPVRRRSGVASPWSYGVFLVLAVSIYWFQVPLLGSVWLLLALCLVYLLTTLGLGLFVSTISETQQQAMMTSTFFFLTPMIYLSGFIFPIENMPSVIQTVTYLIPLRYFIVILRGIFLKGLGLAMLWPQALALFGWGAAILALAVARSRKTSA